MLYDLFLFGVNVIPLFIPVMRDALHFDYDVGLFKTNPCYITAKCHINVM